MDTPITREDLSKIWRRWDSWKKPAGTEERIRCLIRPAFEKIKALMLLAEQAVERTGAEPEPDWRKKMWGIIFSSFMQCYYIGYELAAGDCPDSDRVPFTNAAVVPIDDLLGSLLGMIVKGKVRSLENGEAMIMEIINWTGRAAYSVCLFGYNNFSLLQADNSQLN